MDNRPRAQHKNIALFLLLFITLSGGVVSSVFAEDRLELDSISIKGSRELPKVLYIVPWKSARLGVLGGGAGSKTFDTEMEALDRDVFRRQVEYYGMLFGKPGSGAGK